MVLNLRPGGAVRVKTGQKWDKDIACKTNVLAKILLQGKTWDFVGSCVKEIME